MGYRRCWSRFFHSYLNNLTFIEGSCVRLNYRSNSNFEFCSSNIEEFLYRLKFNLISKSKLTRRRVRCLYKTLLRKRGNVFIFSLFSAQKYKNKNNPQILCKSVAVFNVQGTYSIWFGFDILKAEKHYVTNIKLKKPYHFYSLFFFLCVCVLFTFQYDC